MIPHTLSMLAQTTKFNLNTHSEFLLNTEKTSLLFLSLSESSLQQKHNELIVVIEGSKKDTERIYINV